MAYKYKHFIPQNIAPKGAKAIVVYDADGKKIESIKSIDLGRLRPPTESKLYSFGLVSDCHTSGVYGSAIQASAKLRKALSYMEEYGCNMVIGCGDFTNTGFYYNDANDYNESQMSNYSNIISNCGIPVFELYGNHENYWGRNITLNLQRAKELTGIPSTAYTVSNSADTDTTEGTTVRPNRQVTVIGNDLFIMVGQSSQGEAMSVNDLSWLENTLANNRGRRCFVFIHTFIDDNWDDKTAGDREAEDKDGYILNDSGNPCGARGNAITGGWEDSNQALLNRLLNAFRNAPNLVIFHGHSHMKFESQAFDECANYTDKNGFKSVHVPSLGSPRTLLNSNGEWDVTKLDDNYTQPDSQCYIVDVYEDCIVLNGMDLVNKEPVPLGTYKIDTTRTR